jgi:hypothetical protein
MCFSASVSFAAGSVLSVVGIATLSMTTRRQAIAFAAIPLLFGIQQISEGLIWLSLRHGVALPVGTLTLFYSLFSHVIWPIFVPFAIGLLETEPWRKKALMACQIAGLVVGFYLLYIVLKFPVIAQIQGDHIAYESPHFYILVVVTLYLTATCISGLLSSDRIVQLFGALALISSVLAYIIHVKTWISVWCFFAAVLSVVIWWFCKKEWLAQRAGQSY